MLLLRNLDELSRRTAALGRRRGLGGILVPTMGALHDGHAALIREGADRAARQGLPAGCVVSIFVNPTQFNQRSDYDRYPRTLDADLAICESAGAATVFAPDVDSIYPPGAPPPIPPLPAVADGPGLEDSHRPGHFAGVCQVVMRLFRLLEPSGAIFGEKDWQQLQVITAMTEEAGLPVGIIPYPTIRAPDGLALSSRNRFLSAAEREAALSIWRALARAGAHRDPAAAEAAMREELARASLRPEYAAVRDARTLRPIPRPVYPGRALIAAWAGSTRLIDNAPWPAAT